MYPLCALGAVIAAYLLGSINFAVIFSKIFIKKDVRELGSGNAGMTNVMRAVGVLPGILTFLFDALKGFAGCMVGKLIFDYIFEQTANPIYLVQYGVYACGLACMIGHVFPIFFKFKGGKGVAISVGIFSVCCPIAIILGLIIFGILLATVKIMSISSLTATVVVVTTTVVYNLIKPTGIVVPQIIFALIMGFIVFIKHKENIGRLIRGEEKKFTVKKG